MRKGRHAPQVMVGDKRRPGLPHHHGFVKAGTILTPEERLLRALVLVNPDLFNEKARQQ
jgi:hypothetical protein